MSKSYTPTQTLEAKQLSVDLLDSPEDFYMHNRRYSASVIMQIIYGRRIPTCKIMRDAKLIQGTVKRSVRFIVLLQDLLITDDQEHFLSIRFLSLLIRNFSISSVRGDERGSRCRNWILRSIARFEKRNKRRHCAS